MSATATLPATIEFPALPAGYSWSVTDHLGNPDGDPKDEVYRPGQRVVIAIHRTYRFAFIRFSVRVGRVAAYVISPTSKAHYIQETVDEVFASFQRRLAAEEK